LYLPDGGDRALETPGGPIQYMPHAAGRCAPEMVDVRGQFCIDRYEASLLDARTGRELSPYFAPNKDQVRRNFTAWQPDHFDCTTDLCRTLRVPDPPDWELSQPFTPTASARPGVVPSGYLSGEAAQQACANAGKRLCTPAEWVLACRGQGGRKFPYGDQYRDAACNVNRSEHPARVLHGNASINHMDPRLNLVEGPDGPLLRRTGATPECRSEWGDDAVFDMVGNLDEWVDDPGGRFQGGFYSRNTKEGCDAAITAHPPAYYDYSLGVRCCR
jgi:hypothetical protein